MTFKELQQKKAHLQHMVQEEEGRLQIQWRAMLGSNHPVLIGLNLLSGTFSQAKFNPIVSVLQAAVFVYRDFKEEKLPGKDSILEYLAALMSRVVGNPKRDEG
jgi:hypothetical protein